MSIYALKPKFQAFLYPLASVLARLGARANQVTVATAVVSVLVGGFVAWRLPDPGAFVLIPAWMLVRMALNAVDGLLARDFGQKSRLGAYLNELADGVSDCALYLPFAWLPPFSPLWVGIVIVLALLCEYAGALGPLVGASRRHDGPTGKSDRAVVFGALGLWAGLAAPLPDWTALILPIVGALLVATIVNRVRAGLHEARSHE